LPVEHFQEFTAEWEEHRILDQKYPRPTKEFRDLQGAVPVSSCQSVAQTDSSSGKLLIGSRVVHDVRVSKGES
jgi:hypothetical protein